ncbi:MAG: hypothetical protein KJZ84_15275 [Bryobacteraceae bacterium]|nr:hypothetical protein [Solibacteraceae bacterium]MCL4795921.1 hypothetical protein [Bryobacteraceae bacterium]
MGVPVTCSVIKEWHSVPSAQVLPVSKDLGKQLVGDAADKAADHMLEQAAASQTLHQKMFDKALRGIDHYSRMLAQTARQKVRNKAMKKLGEKITQHGVAEQGLHQAGRVIQAGRAVKTGVPIIFAAWDILDAFSDSSETMQSVR